MPFPPRYFPPSYFPENYFGPGGEGADRSLVLAASETADIAAFIAQLDALLTLAGNEAQDTASCTVTIEGVVTPSVSKGGYVSTNFRDRPTDAWLVARQKLEWVFNEVNFTPELESALWPILEQTFKKTAKYPRAPTVLAARSLLRALDTEPMGKQVELLHALADAYIIVLEDEKRVLELVTQGADIVEAGILLPKEAAQKEWAATARHLTGLMVTFGVDIPTEERLWVALRKAYIGRSKYPKGNIALAARKTLDNLDAASFSELVEADRWAQEDEELLVKLMAAHGYSVVEQL